MRRVLLPLLPCFALAGIAAAQSVAGDASPMVGGEGAVPARATRLPASAQQGAMVLGVTHPAATVEHAGRSLRVTTYGSFAFGISRDQTGEAIVRIRQPASGWIEHRVAITPRDWPVERIDGVPPAHKGPLVLGHEIIGRRADGGLVLVPAATSACTTAPRSRRIRAWTSPRRTERRSRRPPTAWSASRTPAST